jgi:hypothetical protein
MESLSPLCLLKKFTGIFRLFRKKPGTVTEISQKSSSELSNFSKIGRQSYRLFRKKSGKVPGLSGKKSA